ncbi:MAG: DUF1588 domain-containing protein, partial [Deltaproteobacteria bacterium]|nr:DUF1588 domain-containing protein [Deltaproteobacteria bacterium]
PAFARVAYAWWQDTLKLGDDPLFDQAAAFAAQVTFENRSYSELLTATSGHCGSFDQTEGAFVAADCTNGVPEHAGLLTHPAAMKQYFSNLAFRRVKWVQETFACTQFPVENAAEPTDVGGLAPYTGLYPFDSVPGLDTGRIDFRDTSAVICANCHSTMNHIAPLFAYFDEDGQYTAEMSVPTPLEGSPLAQLSDYLIDGESLAWRYGGAATPTLPALGAEMVADPAIAECAIARAWNWALGKGDVVEALREVPTEIIADQITAFAANEYKFKDALFAVFTSEDFVRF